MPRKQACGSTLYQLVATLGGVSGRIVVLACGVWICHWQISNVVVYSTIRVGPGLRQHSLVSAETIRQEPCCIPTDSTFSYCSASTAGTFGRWCLDHRFTVSPELGSKLTFLQQYAPDQTLCVTTLNIFSTTMTQYGTNFEALNNVGKLYFSF